MNGNLILCSRSFFCLTVEKQFESTVERMFSTGENDSDFSSKCRQPFRLTVEELASTSELHFESMVASFSFASKDKERNDMTQRLNYLPQRSNLLPQRAKNTVNDLTIHAKNNINLLGLYRITCNFKGRYRRRA